MAFAYLNPQTAPWRSLGVHYLLAPGDLPPELSLCADRGDPLPSQARHAASRPAAQAAPRFRDGGAQAPGRPGRVSVPAARPRPPASPPAASVPPASRAEQPPRAPTAPESSAASWQPLAPALWPAPWQELLARTRPGLVAWTYWHLGSDLQDGAQAGKAERRDFFRRILQDLACPQGTHTFWPVCLPAAAGEPQADAGMFWSGLQALRSRGVIIMGSAAARASGLPGPLQPLTQRMVRGRLVWILPDVDRLIGDASGYSTMRAFLRKALHILFPR